MRQSRKLSVLSLIFMAILQAMAGVTGRDLQQDKLRWWQEARLGLFVHWGPVALTGEEISWSRWQTGIQRYDSLYLRFNPKDFNADEWVAQAQQAGMKYVVFTAKHHDGFCMWDTKTTDYKITNAPFGRDVCRELADAVHRAGLRLGWYYSPADWKDANCRNPETNGRYVQRSLDEIRELMTNYGKVDLLWTDYEGSASPVQPELIYQLANELQPGIITNNRLDVLHTDESHSMIGPNGDYATPEGFVAGYGNIPWETCTNMGHQWAWRWGDEPRGLQEMAHTVLRCVGGNGNLLLNVGPDSLGVFPPAFRKRMNELGEWIKPIERSIYGTKGGPYTPTRSYVCTSEGSNVYLHILHFDGDTLRLPALSAKILQAESLTGGAIDFCQTKEELLLVVPPHKRRKIATTIQLRINRKAETLALTPPLSTTGSLSYQAKVAASSSVGQFFHTAGAALDDDASTCWVIGRRPEVDVHKYFGTDFHYLRDSVEFKNIYQDNGWIEIDLGKKHTVSRVKLIERQFYHAKILDFEVQYKQGRQWITWTRDTEMGTWERKLPPVKARHFRLVINKRRYMAGVCEFQLFNE